MGCDKPAHTVMWPAGWGLDSVSCKLLPISRAIHEQHNIAETLRRLLLSVASVLCSIYAAAAYWTQTARTCQRQEPAAQPAGRARPRR